MAYSIRTIGIVSASTFSLVLIAGAYAISGPLPFRTSIADAQSTHELLVSYASKDSDSDGLPDWEEALYGTDPNNAHSVNPNQTDREAVAQGLVKTSFATATSTPVDGKSLGSIEAGPTTLTDQFAKTLFGQYLKTRGNSQRPPSSEEIARFVEEGVKELKAGQSVQNTFNLGQVHVVGSGPDALLAYASDAEKAMAQSNIADEKTELDYFSDAVNNNDARAVTHVANYARAYGQMGKALMQINVPKEVASSHLALANALMHLSDSVLSMSMIQSDPLRAMLGMAEYKDDVTSVASVLKQVHVVFMAENVVPAVGDSGWSFYHTAEIASGKK